jgi:hypothetical protein
MLKITNVAIPSIENFGSNEPVANVYGECDGQLFKLKVYCFLEEQEVELDWEIPPPVPEEELNDFWKRLRVLPIWYSTMKEAYSAFAAVKAGGKPTSGDDVVPEDANCIVCGSPTDDEPYCSARCKEVYIKGPELN